MLRRRMFRMLRPAPRSAFGVQNLRRRALHAAVRAEHAAIARLGAQHLVATPALTSQECRHGGHHHFPLRSAYRAGQDRNLDGSASHRAVNPRQEKCFRAAIKSLITVRSQSCTASRGNFGAAAASVRRFPCCRVRCPVLQPLPGSSTHAPETVPSDDSQRENVSDFGTRWLSTRPSSLVSQRIGWPGLRAWLAVRRESADCHHRFSGFYFACTVTGNCREGNT